MVIRLIRSQTNEVRPTNKTVAENAFLSSFVQGSYPNLVYVSNFEPRPANGHAENVVVSSVSGLE